MATLELAIDYLLGNEVSDYGTAKQLSFKHTPGDPKGAMNWGVSEGMLAMFRHKSITEEDVKSLTKMEATEIYRVFYWDKLWLVQVKNQNVATAILDTGVSFGVYSATKLVQRALNSIGELLLIDGFLRSLTIKALNSVDPNRFIKALEVIVIDNYETESRKNSLQPRVIVEAIKRAVRLDSLITKE